MLYIIYGSITINNCYCFFILTPNGVFRENILKNIFQKYKKIIFLLFVIYNVP